MSSFSYEKENAKCATQFRFLKDFSQISSFACLEFQLFFFGVFDVTRNFVKMLRFSTLNTCLVIVKVMII